MFYFAEDAPNWTLNVVQSEKLQKIHSGGPGGEPTKGGEQSWLVQLKVIDRMFAPISKF